MTEFLHDKSFWLGVAVAALAYFIYVRLAGEKI